MLEGGSFDDRLKLTLMMQKLYLPISLQK